MVASRTLASPQVDILTWCSMYVREIVKRCSLPGLVRDSIEHGKLYLIYQPQFNVKEGKVDAVEALLRWEEPSFGDIPPEEFIPLFEETGLLNEVSGWVFSEVCKQLVVWKMRDVVFPKVSINVSQSQLRQPEFLETVKTIFQRYISDREFKELMNSTRIEFEVHGSDFFSDVTAMAALQELKQMGFGIALDDCSMELKFLADCPEGLIDTVKLEMSCTRNAQASKVGAAVFESFLFLANKLGVEVVAKGVEHMNQLYYLRELGCTGAQGNFVSRPLPEHAFLSWLLQMPACNAVQKEMPRMVLVNG
ncbi:MAG: EAL domain-containing protein [Gammaproteobacteria bacterium]|nr:EAL domain-containing protein [Gammaproteobacteria bacterium]MDH5800099.1 EAL domain-containing protein [Gammaproteobacteria bacterium]